MKKLEKKLPEFRFCMSSKPAEDMLNVSLFGNEKNLMAGKYNGFRIVNLSSLFNANLTKLLPRVLNTVENGYRQIYLYGESAFAKRILLYLRENKAVGTICVAKENLVCKGGKYILSVVADCENCILLSAELIKTLPVEDINGEMISSVFIQDIWQNKYDGGEEDIVRNIIPYLKKRGVDVICQTSLVISELQPAQQISSLITCAGFICLRLLFGKKRINAMAFRRFGTPELIEESWQRKIDRSCGYVKTYNTGHYFNYKFGFRETIGNSAGYKRRVIVFGPCYIAGGYVKDADTIPSKLKARLSDDWIVVNRGACSCIGVNYSMRNFTFREGDIVVVALHRSMAPLLEKIGVPVLNISESVGKIKDFASHISDSIKHCDAVVSEQIANDLYEFLLKNDLLKEKTDTCGKAVVFGNLPKRAPLPEMLNSESFNDWIVQMKPFKQESGRVGAIVMNCNPFTKGHRYLIETAAQQVDKLFVFVVEEDKSYFPFKDRLQLVRRGVADISNVEVFPSGKFMISSQSLPGYFDKNSIGNIYLDASEDLLYFAVIAKELNIKIRFAGEEPSDIFTKQYNDNMREMLSEYGIEFVEIERVKSGENYISASSVRRLLEQKNFVEIEKLVPETTYQYLVKKFSSI